MIPDMPSRSHIVSIWLLLTALMLCGVSAETFASRAPVEADSALRAYTRVCKSRLSEPEGYAYADTLFMRAEAAGNVKLQTIALCYRLDHYYYDNDRNGIVDNVKRVQEFCREHGKQELSYFYYFVWSSRLITFYIKQGQYNVAVYETRRMLSEAQAEQNMQAVADCYRMLANIYLSQEAYEEAYENLRRCLAVLETHGIEDINMPTQYAALAQCALELNRPDSAFVALHKAASLPKETSYQRFTVDKAFALYYIDRKDFRTAKQYLDRCEELFRGDAAMRPYAPGLHYLKRVYFKATGQYERALEAVRQSQSDTLLKVTNYQYYTYARDLGDIYFLMGDMRHSAENYRDYIHVSDSVRTVETRSATNDFSGILEIARLQGETRELQLDLQRKRLRNTYMVTASLVLVLLLVGLVFAREVKLNRRLKSSEARILAQNEKLKITGEELLRAKENAEQASRMKTSFIQSMSHEVRTPLNSIVGFSQVLASQFRGDPSAGEYASIIEESSLNLMRLIDDVLNIAFLDQAEGLPCTDFCSLNECCRECADKIQREVRNGVTLVVEPSAEDTVVFTNPQRIRQVVMHLLHNAAKFTCEGQIVLGYDCLPDESLLRFVVTDTGPGIPEEQRETVFERFVKLDSFSQGTGLGLPVCRIIAAKLGGRLYLDPGYKSGCRFVFEVPFDPSHKQE